MADMQARVVYQDEDSGIKRVELSQNEYDLHDGYVRIKQRKGQANTWLVVPMHRVLLIEEMR